MKNLMFFYALSLLFMMGTTACNNDDDEVEVPSTITTAGQLTDVLMDIYEDGEAPGFMVSVVKNDAVIYQEGFGKADIQTNRDYTKFTTQPIGSISKTFIAAAIVKAIEQGHFTLDTDINDILPVELKNPKQPDATITVKHLVTHTSGLIDNNVQYLQAYHVLPGEDLSTPGAEVMIDGFGAQQRQTLPLDEFLVEYYLPDGDAYSMNNFAATAPGTQWQYSNIASSLTAYLVEAATGESFKDYVATHIFAPLGMQRTAYDWADLDPANYASLYWDKNTPLPLYSNDSYPDAGVITCSEDLTRYLQDMMRGRRGESTTLFSEDGYALLFDELLPAGIMPAQLGTSHGVFWFLNEGNVSHSGADPGVTCNLRFDADGESGYFIMTNMDASTDDHEGNWANFYPNIHNAVNTFLESN